MTLQKTDARRPAQDMNVCDLVHCAYVKNLQLGNDEDRPLLRTLHQRRLWKSLQVAFASTRDEEALAVEPVLPAPFRKPHLHCPRKSPTRSPLTVSSDMDMCPEEDTTDKDTRQQRSCDTAPIPTDPNAVNLGRRHKNTTNTPAASAQPKHLSQSQKEPRNTTTVDVFILPNL